MTHLKRSKVDQGGKFAVNQTKKATNDVFLTTLDNTNLQHPMMYANYEFSLLAAAMINILIKCILLIHKIALTIT